MIAFVHSIYSQSVHSPALNAGLMDNDAERYCTFKARDKSTMLTLFKSLVLPRLEYGCQLWCPAKVNQIRAMESIRESLLKILMACIRCLIRKD